MVLKNCLYTLKTVIAAVLSRPKYILFFAFFRQSLIFLFDWESLFMAKQKNSNVHSYYSVEKHHEGR